MLPSPDESRSFFTAGARVTLVRRLAVAPPDERPLSVPEARSALREECFGPARDAEIISTYRALVRGPLRPVDGEAVEHMRGALLEAAERGNLLVFEPGSWAAPRRARPR